MRIPADERVDRSFWLIDRDGERYFPIRVPRKGDGSVSSFRVSDAGNTVADSSELDDVGEVQELVVNHGFSVRVVPERDVTKPPSLLKLNARKILSWGSSSGEEQSLASYWRALAATAGDPDAGWSHSLKSWVRPKQRNGVYVSIALNGREGWLRIGLGIVGGEADQIYESLLARRAAVERAAGDTLIWDSKVGREKRQVFVKLLCDPNDRSDWLRQHEWLAARLPSYERLMELAQ